MRRYLHNKTYIGLILNFLCILHIFKTWAFKYRAFYFIWIRNITDHFVSILHLVCGVKTVAGLLCWETGDLLPYKHHSYCFETIIFLILQTIRLNTANKPSIIPDKLFEIDNKLGLSWAKLSSSLDWIIHWFSVDLVWQSIISVRKY